jgi:DNA primase
VTAFNAGMKNTTAIGSTAFTGDHLDLILNADPPIKHLVFTLDADEAGKKGTEKFVKLLEEKLGGHPGLKVELRLMPDGSDDPDRFIRTSAR